MGTVADASTAEPLLGQNHAGTSAQSKFQRLTDRTSSASSDALRQIQSWSKDPTHKTYLCIAVLAGVVCGFVAYVYSSAFQGLLQIVWQRVPERFIVPLLHKLQKRWGWQPDSIAWVYTVITSTAMGTLAGLVQSLMGSPGDLPETIECIHKKVRWPQTTTCKHGYLAYPCAHCDDLGHRR